MRGFVGYPVGSEPILRRILRTHLGPFLFATQAAETELPSYVKQELRGVLTCGELSQGAACFHCASCEGRKWVPFSCKRRGYAEQMIMRSK